MLIAVKIGNSTVSIALFDNPLSDRFSSIMTFDIKKESEMENKIKKFFSEIKKEFDTVICSVVPDLTEKILKLLKSKKNIVINYKTETGLELKLKNPQKFGADRLTTSVGAYNLFKENMAVVDFGTATTITVVTKKAEIIGGAIMPGINMMRESLTEKTAMLPYVDLNKKISVLGNETHSAIRSGIILGTVCAVEGIIDKIEKEESLKLKTVLTGGWSEFLSRYFNKKINLKPYLVFEGMRLIYLKNINS